MAKDGPSNVLNEEYEPYCEWKRLEDSDVLDIHLTGFKKEELRVWMKNNSELILLGERVAAKDEKKIQFKKEIKLSNDINTDQIRAKFGGPVLSIIMPKKSLAAITKPKPDDDDDDGVITITRKYNAKPKNFISESKSSFSRLKLSMETAVTGVIVALGVYYLIKNCKQSRKVFLSD